MLVLSIVLGACGFKLKQAHPLPFNTLYTNISDNSAFGAQLRRVLRVNSPSLRFVSQPELAQVQLIQEQLRRSVRELSLDPSGQVENYELHLELIFSLIDASGQAILPSTVLSSTREIPNSPNNSEAKAQEMETLFQSMEMSLVDRVLRRLSASDIAEAYEASLHPQTSSPTPKAQPPASATSFN
ncbi:hypothetical protein PAEH1_04885 [Paenalcaligenes hominis]|uniref:LPS-assembly lipoprotein LptE n=1 Tax=Paenalcaligenes hominis TaxID=643674 RepID=A0A1U9K2P9_9BURK|nr:hypothetical protein PAEH1_04885 [Paenalcaligenes hominis]